MRSPADAAACWGARLLTPPPPPPPAIPKTKPNKLCAQGAPPRFLVDFIAWALFAYLEGSVPGQLKWLYPNGAARADAWLADEILRAACDPRSLEVFKSVFYLPPPRALNFLINAKYGGPVLVLQARAEAGLGRGLGRGLGERGGRRLGERGGRI